METTASARFDSDGSVPDAPAFELAPPGERYYRHPGDVVRLVLWGIAALLLAIVIAVGTHTSDGVTADFGRVAARTPRSIRELLLALTQIVAIAVPAAVAIGLTVMQRWRRLSLLVLAGAAGWVVWVGLETVIDLPGRLPDAVTSGTWVASTRFPSLAYFASMAAVAMVGKPWLGRQWRRAADMSLFGLAIVMAVAGSAGVPALLLAACAGAVAGAALLVGFGAPNRRPAPATVAACLTEGGIPVATLQLQRVEGGRSQLYIAEDSDGARTFVKVFGRDSRDADLLYRGYRALLLRGPNDGWASPSLKLDVEHEALLLLLARQGGVACPRVVTLGALADDSMVLALEYVDGGPLDDLAPEQIDDGLLESTWTAVATLHRRGMAHRALRAANVLVGAGEPVIIDLGFGEESATPRMQAIDRAELLASLGALVGPDRAVASAVRSIGAATIATALPYLQPLALSAATRKQMSKARLHELRDALATARGVEAPPLERLIRVRPRTLIMITALTGAFYVLLPQLANVGDSFVALRQASVPWLVVSIVMSLLTYVGGAIGVAGGVPEHIPFVPNVLLQLASSFVNRVSPANVGGMALNVRFLQKAGVPTPEAVTGVGLNSIVGAIVHMLLLVLFFTWAGQGGGAAFSVPGGSKMLAVLAILLAIIGIVLATRRGRRLARVRVLGFFKRSWGSIVVLARSPVKIAALFGGSLIVTLAYIGALAAAVLAVDGGLSIAEVGAVVAGLTGVGMASGPAVAAVLSYRLVTYWLPIVPGWFSFHVLERRGLI